MEVLQDVHSSKCKQLGATGDGRQRANPICGIWVRRSDAKRSKTPHDPKNLTEDVSGSNCKHTVDACAS